MTTSLIETKLETFDAVDQDIANALAMVQSGVSDPQQWLVDSLGGGSVSASGTVVNSDTVLGIPAAWNSINLIAGHIGAMPKEHRRKLPGGGSERMEQTAADRVCNRSVNLGRIDAPLYTPFTFWQTLMTHALLTGNGRAVINRDGNGAPMSLTLLQPESTYTIVSIGAKYHVTYFTRDMYSDVVSPTLEYSLQRMSSADTLGGAGWQYTLPDEEVLHIPGLGYNGLWGYPLTAVAKDTFGLELSGLGAVSYQFNNGGRPGLLITAPKGMLRTEKESNEFMRQFAKAHSGLSNTGKTGLLREGMGVTTVPASSIDSGLSDLRESSRDDVALLFGTEYLLGNTSAVYKDLPDRMAAYITNTLNKWMQTIEEECNRKLLTDKQTQSGQYFHCNATCLLRGSPNSLADYTGKLRTQAIISGNEARELHGYNPVPELSDDYGNPNTATEPAAEEPEEEEEPEQEESTIDEEMARQRLAYNFRSLIEFEQKKVIAAAKSGEDFVGKLERFYNRYTKQLKEVCRDLGIDESLADQHVSKSKALIAELLGCIQQDQITDEVTSLVSDWVSRSRDFANVL